MDVVARAVRDGKWWAVEFDGPTGTFHTQAGRLDQIQGMVRDILDMEGVDPSVRIVVQAVVPGAQQEAVAAARDAAAVAARAVDDSAVKSRRVVAQFGEGFAHPWDEADDAAAAGGYGADEVIGLRQVLGDETCRHTEAGRLVVGVEKGQLLELPAGCPWRRRVRDPR